MLARADCHLAPVQQALVGAFVFEAHFAALAEDRCDGIDAQFSGLLDRPIHALAPGQALAEVHMQGRFGLAGKAIRELHGDAFFTDFQQGATKLLAGAVEQLHGIAFTHAQHTADVMRLGFGQFVVTETQRGVGEKAGQSHVCSLKRLFM